MSQDPAEQGARQDQDTRQDPDKRLWKMFMPLAGVTGAMAFLAVIYFGYDIVKGKLSPCDSIFQQASVGLSTKISFLKTEGELKLGREKVTDLDERADGGTGPQDLLHRSGCRTHQSGAVLAVQVQGADL